MLRLVGLRCCPPWPSIACGSARLVPSRTIVSGACIQFGGCSLYPLDLRADFPDATRSCGSNSGLDTDRLLATASSLSG